MFYLNEVNKLCKLKIVKLTNLNAVRFLQFGICENGIIEVLKIQSNMLLIKIENSMFALNMEFAKCILVKEF